MQMFDADTSEGDGAAACGCTGLDLAAASGVDHGAAHGMSDACALSMGGHAHGGAAHGE
jgi:hypothetical protein